MDPPWTRSTSEPGRMDSGRDTPWRESFVVARDFRSVGDHSSIYRAVARGDLYRVLTGVYLPSAQWSALDRDRRRLALIDANGLLHPRDGPYSHLSAAALWGLPIVDRWPDRLEVLVPEGIELRSRRSLQRRSGPPDARMTVIDDHRTTSLARTVIDVARTTSTALSVAMADRAMRVPPEGARGVAAASLRGADLREQLDLLSGTRGIVRATRAVELADGMSGSPGESVSRVAMHALGFPAPKLQHAFWDGEGLIGIADFWWPEFGLIGEFDGFGKYLRESLTGGRSVADIVLAEKKRENRLRALGPTVARWGWADARSPRRLEAILTAARLPQRGLRRRS